MKVRFVYLFFGLGVLSIIAQSYIDGAPPGYSGSPSDNNTCAESTCHGGSVTEVLGWISTNIPATGYELDSNYTITVSAAHIGASRFGFCLSPQDVFGNVVGELTSTSGTQLRGLGKYITHIPSSINAIDSNDWTFSWKAPSIEQDSVTFYCAFNAANGNDQPTGDVIYKTKLVAQSIKTNTSTQNKMRYTSNLLTYSYVSKSIIYEGNSTEVDLRVYDSKGNVIRTGFNNTMTQSRLPSGVYIAAASAPGKRIERLKFIVY